MKKGFKRFLSGALATVMAVAGMTVGMATSAMAAELSSGNLKSVNGLVTTWDFTTITSNSSNAEANDTIEGIIVLDPGNRTYLKSGDKALSSKSDKGKDPVLAVPVKSEEGNVTIFNSADQSKRFLALTVNGVADDENKKALSKSGSSFDYTSSDITKINDNNYVVFTITGGEAKLTSIVATAVLEKGTGSITGTVTGYDVEDMIPEPDGKFQYEGVDFTVNYETGSYTIPELSNGTYTITYTGTYYTMEPVEVVVSDQTTPTIKDLTLVERPNAKNVTLNVVNATNQTVTLTGENLDIKYSVDLINGSAVIDKILIDTYNVGINGGTIEPTEFSVNTNTTELNATFTKIYAQPITGTIAKIDIGEELPPTEEDYTIPDGDAFLTYFTSHNVVQRSDSRYGIQVRNLENQSFEFTTTVPLKLIIGYSSTGGSNTSDIAVIADGAEENIAYGVVKGTSRAELTVDYLPAGTYFVYAPNTDDGIVDSKGDPTTRDTRVLDIEFAEADASAAPTITKATAGDGVAVLTDGTNNYVVSIVTRENAELFNTLNQALTTGGNVNATDTVYESIEIGGSIYTATDFYDNANEDDYLFASIIANDNATDAETVISNIQSGITTVLSNENN